MVHNVTNYKNDPNSPILKMEKKNIKKNFFFHQNLQITNFRSNWYVPIDYTPLSWFGLEKIQSEKKIGFFFLEVAKFKMLLQLLQLLQHNLPMVVWS